MEHKQKNCEKIIENYKLIVTFNICNGGGELEGQGHGPRQVLAVTLRIVVLKFF